MRGCGKRREGRDCGVGYRGSDEGVHLCGGCRRGYFAGGGEVRQAGAGEYLPDGPPVGGQAGGLELGFRLRLRIL